jgi:hypothetical protein
LFVAALLDPAIAMGKARIALEMEVLKFTALLSVGVAGGSLSLILGELTFLKKVLAGGNIAGCKLKPTRRTKSDRLRNLRTSCWLGHY